MTNHTDTDELDEILDSVWDEACEMMEDGGTADISRATAKEAILALKQQWQLEVIDRIEAQLPAKQGLPWRSDYPDDDETWSEHYAEAKADNDLRDHMKSVLDEQRQLTQSNKEQS